MRGPFSDIEDEIARELSGHPSSVTVVAFQVKYAWARECDCTVHRIGVVRAQPLHQAV